MTNKNKINDNYITKIKGRQILAKDFSKISIDIKRNSNSNNIIIPNIKKTKPSFKSSIDSEKEIKIDSRILKIAEILNMDNEAGLDRLLSLLKTAQMMSSLWRGFSFLQAPPEPISIANITKSLSSVLTALSNKEIPDSYDRNLTSSIVFRDFIIERQGFTLISKEWIKPLAKWIGNKNCLEIMSGKGTLSYALKQEGVNIKATDDFSWSKFTSMNTWCDIEQIDAVEAIEKYGKDMDYIIMSWCYMDDTGYKCLKKMREINPNCKMLYIGEWQGGCTGNDEFFESLVEICDESFEKIAAKLPQWSGIHDRLCLIN